MKSIEAILKALFYKYPDPSIALSFSTPLELLIATILSAQATDKKVNEVTEKLFKKYRTAQDYASADISVLEDDIRQINFFRNKARMIKKCCQQISEGFGGKVPDNLDDLTRLSGIGRKTANVILGSAFGKDAIAVDTHVIRVSRRLGITDASDPEKIEAGLMSLLPKDVWTRFSLAIILHGRETCKAKKPLCESCALNKHCEFAKAQGR